MTGWKYSTPALEHLNVDLRRHLNMIISDCKVQQGVLYTRMYKTGAEIEDGTGHRICRQHRGSLLPVTGSLHEFYHEYEESQ